MKTKKILALLIAVVLTMSAIPFGSVLAETNYDEIFDYRENGDGTITIGAYLGDDTVCIIPDEINGKKVTAIGDSAFEYNIITSITISNNVTSIGDYSFYSCDSLTTIKMSENVTAIGTAAFYDCKKLKSITIPKGITSISDSTFVGCKALTTVIIPDGVISIGRSAFSGCTSLTSVTIPEGVTTIDEWAFMSCDKLTTVTVPKSVTNICNKAFGYTNDGKNTIEGFTIEGYKGSAAEVYADEEGFDFNAIAESPFVTEESYDGTLKITGYTGNDAEVTIPSEIDGKRVTAIGSEAFLGKTNLRSVTIPEGIMFIDYKAFCDCYSLRSITIPFSVTYIGSLALGFDSNYSQIQDFTIKGYKDSAAQRYAEQNRFTFENIFKGTYLTNEDSDGTLSIKRYFGDDINPVIPSEINGKMVTSINESSFFQTQIETVTIPNSITGIGSSAFEKCMNLKTVTIEPGENEVSLWYLSFYQCPNLKIITIPKNVVEIEDYALGYLYPTVFDPGDDGEPQHTPIDRFTVRGYRNSAAEKYVADANAKGANFIFIPIDEATIGANIGINAGADFTINFKVSNMTDKERENALVYFAMNGETTKVQNQQNDIFKFKGIGAKNMTDTVNAVLYDNDTESKKELTKISNFTIRDYAKSLINDSNTSDKTKTLLKDMLNYGAAAQNYFKYKTDDLANKDLDYTATYTRPEKPVYDKTMLDDGKVHFTAQNVSHGNVNKLMFRFKIADGVDANKVVIRITDGENSYDIDSSKFVEYDITNNEYYVESEGIFASEFGKEFKAKAVVNGDETGAYVGYSINSYVFAKWNSTVPNLKELVRNMYNYGVSASALKNVD